MLFEQLFEHDHALSTAQPATQQQSNAAAIRRHRYAMHDAAMGQIVDDGIVLGASVIPDGNGVRHPPQPDMVLWSIGDVEEHGQKSSTLGRRHANDPSGKRFADVQIRTSTYWMMHDDRVYCYAGLTHRLDNARVASSCIRSVAKSSHVMHDLELGQLALQPIAERLVHRVHTRPQRVATNGRQFNRPQDRCERWTFAIGHVAMPFSGVGRVIALPTEHDDIVGVRVRGVAVVASAKCSQRLT